MIEEGKTGLFGINSENSLMRMVVLLISIILSISSCSDYSPHFRQSHEVFQKREPSFNQEQIIDFAWDALEPNTSSHNRSSWQVKEVRMENGDEMAERFEGDPAPGCWSGPEPAENKGIKPGEEYWFVFMVPKPATSMPVMDTPSPTAPPLIPEPFLREAYFFLDKETGEIVARKLICVIY